MTGQGDVRRTAYNSSQPAALICIHTYQSIHVTTSTLRNWLALASISLLLSACGGDRNQPASTSTPAPTTSGAASAGPVAITAQPLSTAVSAGGTATFTVGASGDGLSYQWQRNGEALPGATRASYTTPAVSTTDSGTRYQVIVKSSQGELASQSATLTVTESGFVN